MCYIHSLNPCISLAGHSLAVYLLLGGDCILHVQHLSKGVFTVKQLLFSRYPTFIDAVRDLDDALSMLVLFSMMPQTDKIQVYIRVILTSC